MARENRFDEFNHRLLTLGPVPGDQGHRLLECLCIIDELTSSDCLPNDGRLYVFYRWTMLQDFTLFERDYGLLCKRWHGNEEQINNMRYKREPVMNL